MQPENQILGSSGTQDFSRLAQTLQLRKSQVEAVIKLLAEGFPPPFIARYRRALTAGMPEATIRTIQEKLQRLAQFQERSSFILKSLESQGKLTEELKKQIEEADSPRTLEDLFLPFRPRKNSYSAEARAKGLENFAAAILNADPVVADPREFAQAMVSPEKGLDSADLVLAGMVRILADQFSENAHIRRAVREILWETGKLTSSRSARHPEKHSSEYREFFSFTEPVKELHPRKFLSLERGVKAGILNLQLNWDKEKAKFVGLRALLAVAAVPPPPAGETSGGETPPHPSVPEPTHAHLEWIRQSLDAAIDQVLGAILEKECLRDLAEKAAEHVAHILARCLHNRLMAAGSPPMRLLAIDPGFRTGCKLAVLNEHGNVLDHGLVFPHQPQGKKELALLRMEELVRKHQVQGLALGNGNACKATELLVAELIQRLESPQSAPAELEILAPAPIEQAESSLAPGVVEDETPAPVPVIAEPVPVIVEPVPVITEPALETPPAEATPVPAAESSETPVPSGEAPTVPMVAAESEEEKKKKEAEEKKKKEADEQRRKERERRQAEYLEQVKAARAGLAELPPSPKGVSFTMVLESGASEYAGSMLGKEELADLDAGIRAAVSIGRRVLNPLKELSKIDPTHLVSGMIGLDLPQRQIRTALEGMVDYCVTCDGLDLATAEKHLLRHVPGLNSLLAQNICDFRVKNGGFKSRQQLLEVDQMTPQRFELAAGFLYLFSGDEPFDATNLHPLGYEMAEKVLAAYGMSKADWNSPGGHGELFHRARNANLNEMAEKTGVGSLPALRDFLDELTNPLAGLKAKHFGPIFRSRILTLQDLQPGMELQGVIQNVVEFGCFADVGLKESGLIHISQISAKYVRSPFESVSVGDVVRVWVLSVDQEKQRVSLTMIRPGSEHSMPRHDHGRGRPVQARGGHFHSDGPPATQAAPSGQAPAPQHDRPPQQSNRSSSRFRSDRPPSSRPPRRENQGPPQPQVRTFTSKKPVAKPVLSQSALSGSSPLGTFAELAVFWEKKDPEPQPKMVAPPQESPGQEHPAIGEKTSGESTQESLPPTPPAASE